MPIDPWSDLTEYQLLISKYVYSEPGGILDKHIVIKFSVRAYQGC